MFSSARSSTLLKVGCLALALWALDAVPALAKKAADTAPSSVEIFVDQNAPATAVDGVLPEGMKWNRPLKAGDLALPRKAPAQEPAPAKSKLKAPSLPIGEVKAPQLSATKSKATPPVIASESNSTAGVMLLQGLKNAIQQSGENPTLPKSDSLPVADKQTEPMMLIEASATPAAIETPAKPNGDWIVVDGNKDGAKPADAADSLKYEPGQEPKAFVAPKGGLPPAVTSEDRATDIVYPPEMAAKKVEETPKSDLLPLTQAQEIEVNPPVAPSPVEPLSSLFGAPVKETPEDKAEDDLIAAELPKAPIAEPAAKKVGKCKPSVSSWTRSCAEAGYPAHFIGQIVGETRVECPSGEARDIWLSNSCAASVERAPAASGVPNVPEATLVEGSTGPVDASCGVANGLAANAKPFGDLCAAGEPSAVSGDGPWRWTCKGQRGGVTVSCAAPVAPKPEAKPAKSGGKAAAAAENLPEDGLCGAANGVGADTAPAGALCAKGAPSLVNGDGPWTWACSGVNGGQAAACSAPKRVDGACGAAGKSGTDGMPMRDLCAAGYASAVTGDGPWNWTCSGLHGGAAATCSAQPKVNAVCGPASMTGHRSVPKDGLCSVGKASAVDGSGPWEWSCQGSFGGAEVVCKAPALTDGVCGPAHGSPYTETPADGLCAQGRASRVTGLGPWNWTCAGEDGGTTVSCTAALGSKEAMEKVVSCGAAAETLAFAEPTDNLCAAGKPSTVAGRGPWTWSCSDSAGRSVACSTPAPAEGACGKAAHTAASQQPRTGLCESGSPGSVTADKAASVWKWECHGSMGASSKSCSAPMTAGAAAKAAEAAQPEAVCGSSSGQAFASKPDSNLCAAGKASAVRGSGPWSWTCGGKVKVTCEAQKLAEGVCGSANGTIQKAAPVSGLCNSGAATEVTGEGPWLWSCVGTGGGASVSCSAASQSQTKVDGTCGAAANAVMTTAPEANLCDSGMPSAVYGEGPWTWTCSGLNGGIASTCSTNKVLPKAPPPPGPMVNGLCGPSNGVASLVTPEGGLCSAGTATAISGEGPWNWSCLGSNGGMTVSCTAPLMPPAPVVGMCGSSSGVPTLTAPKGALCAAGIPSAVSGKGPWTWSCSGTNGGGAVSCVAPTARKGASAPLPSLNTPSDEAPAPAAAPAGLVTPQLPAGPLPPLKRGDLPKIKPSKPLDLPPEASALPAAKLDEAKAAPASAPDLPEGAAGLTPPPVRDTLKPTPGLKPPVVDSNGDPIPGARLVLEPEVSTISFARASDQLDKDAVRTVEKLATILQIHGNARITLVAYSTTDGNISPREARRLSLNRALAIRDFLTTKGVPSSRVDVRPMGANVPSGDMDRVDVKVN